MTSEFTVGNTQVGDGHDTYFIADVASNHDGELARAIDLIFLAAEAGANAAKFQNFYANTLVSDRSFKDLVDVKSHQSAWKKSVYEMYDAASISLEWTQELVNACKQAGIHYFTSPYDLSILGELEPFVVAWKIGSGDITWHQALEIYAASSLPIFLATGASTEEDVKAAMHVLTRTGKTICLMQCNTNYTGSRENFNYIELNVLKRYKDLFPECILGLSDHTSGHTTVLGAVALGARVIEKHFTDDISRDGADHGFSMTPESWSEMVDRTRDLEAALGSEDKRVMPNEESTVIVQRRSLHVTRKIEKGDRIGEQDLVALRPCPPGSFQPFETGKVVGRESKRTLEQGECLKLDDLSET
jgi:sialic acid synthase SpsE